jgi:hypothetical protein
MRPGNECEYPGHRILSRFRDSIARIFWLGEKKISEGRDKRYKF